MEECQGGVCLSGTLRTDPKEGLCTCDGLTIRGRHWLVLAKKDDARALRRTLSERLNFPPTYAFSNSSVPAEAQTSFSAVAESLPANVKLQTLTNTYAAINDGRLLLRLAHLYGAGEHPTLSTAAEVDLSKLFGGSHAILSAEEMSLTANQNREEMEQRKYQWNTDGERTGASWIASKGLKVTLRPMEVKTFLVTMGSMPEAPVMHSTVATVGVVTFSIGSALVACVTLGGFQWRSLRRNARAAEDPQIAMSVSLQAAA